MLETINLNQIYNLDGEKVIVIGVSKVEQLAKMRDLGCLGTNKFTTLSIKPCDSTIKKDLVIVFRKGNEMYHNVSTVDENIIIYKSLDNMEGARCKKLSTFEKEVREN